MGNFPAWIDIERLLPGFFWRQRPRISLFWFLEKNARTHVILLPFSKCDYSNSLHRSSSFFILPIFLENSKTDFFQSRIYFSDSCQNASKLKPQLVNLFWHIFCFNEENYFYILDFAICEILIEFALYVVCIWAIAFVSAY